MYEKSTQYLARQEDGIEARRLFRLWEKLRIRASEYKNHTYLPSSDAFTMT